MNGVSTRKIEKIAKRLGIECLSASEVSEINNGLDEMVEDVVEIFPSTNSYIRLITS